MQSKQFGKYLAIAAILLYVLSIVIILIYAHSQASADVGWAHAVRAQQIAGNVGQR
jgi:hypothetical protein